MQSVPPSISHPRMIPKRTAAFHTLARVADGGDGGPTGPTNVNEATCGCRGQRRAGRADYRTARRRGASATTKAYAGRRTASEYKLRARRATSQPAV